MLDNGNSSVRMLSLIIVATLSGCVNVMLTNLIWLVSTRIQSHKKEVEENCPIPVAVRCH